MTFHDKVYASVYVKDCEIKVELSFVNTTAEEFINNDGMTVLHPLKDWEQVSVEELIKKMELR